jgi:ribosomal protein L11 methyltransferase
MSYICINIQTQDEEADMITAELGEIGFDTFLETENGMEASMEKKHFDKAAFFQIMAQYNKNINTDFTIEEVEKQNWNKLWESNFEPVEMNERCIVRADFHVIEKKYDYELIITPKMSFGTGHHQTTSQMINQQMEIDHIDKTVFDAGTGTGILAIMAMKLGAKLADSCDVEDWSVENALENAAANQVKIGAYLNTAAELSKNGKKYDILLANINLHVILAELPAYDSMLRKGGTLLMSGFYSTDVAQVREKAESLGFKFVKQTEKDHWACVRFEK